MNTMVELTETDFDQTLARANLPVVVDVYAPGCGPCRVLAPLLDKMAGRLGDRIQSVKVNVQEAPGLAGRFHITGVPTLLFFKNGAVCDRVIGFSSPRDLAAKLNALLPDKMEAGV